MGFVTMFANSINKKLLSWQLNNSSYTPENKPFVPINTAKCGTEDVARELSHYYYRSWFSRNQVANVKAFTVKH